MKCALYVHIPFCISKCDYCDFFSVPCSSVKDEYLDSVVKEITFYSKLYNISSFSSVYVGGGTPSLLNVYQLEKLFSGIFQSCKEFDKSDCEITIEMNPETITKEKLEVLDKIGVNRLSVGIQSLNDKALSFVNRHCNSKNAINALELIKNNWKNQFNLDVIAGLPNQSNQEFVDSLNKIISYEPNHISMYTLTIEEETPLCKKIDEGFEYDFDKSDETWILGKDILEKAGYHQYEVSNFAKADFQSKHNLCYWKQKDYIGAGCGSCGTVYSGDRGIRWNTTKNIEKYCNFWNKISLEDLNSLSESQIIDFEKTIPREIENLDSKTVEFEYLMMGFRTIYGVNEQVYRQKFSAVEPWFGDLSKRLGVESGVWADFTRLNRTYSGTGKQGKRDFALNEEGLLFLNIFLRELL